MNESTSDMAQSAPLVTTVRPARPSCRELGREVTGYVMTSRSPRLSWDGSAAAVQWHTVFVKVEQNQQTKYLYHKCTL